VVSSAQFSFDGQRVVTVSADRTARVWDALTGQPLTEPLPHLGTVDSAQFSPDGQRVVTASTDNTARVWDIAPSSANHPAWLLDLAEPLSGQVLDPQGIIAPSAQDPAETIKQIRLKLKQESDDNGWVTWGRWFLADSSERTISPFCKIAVPMYI